MPISGTLTSDASSYTAGATANMVLAVSNSGATDLSVISAEPTCHPQVASAIKRASVALGRIALGPGQTTNVPAGGTTNFNYSIIFFAPQPGSQNNENPANPSNIVYLLRVNVITADGTFTRVDGPNITVNAPTH